MQNTGIKETAYSLAKKHGWHLEYAGGLELDGEYVDDADLTWVHQGKTLVLNISWADTTAYGFTLTEENSAAGPAAALAGSSFGLADIGGITLDLPAQGRVLAEKYYITTAADLVEFVEEVICKL